MPAAFCLELYFMALTCLTVLVGRLHLQAYWTWARTPGSRFDMALHRRFVTIQMGFSIAFLGTFFPALAIGLYHAYREPGLLSLLPIPLYLLPKLILAPAKKMEADLRRMVAPTPAAQVELDYIAHVWQHRLLPRF